MTSMQSKFLVAIVFLLASDFFATAQQPELVIQTGHSVGSTCIAFSPDGKMLASGGFDGAVVLWESASGRQLRTLLGNDGKLSGGFLVWSLAFSPNGRILASLTFDTIRLWDVATGRRLHSFNGSSFAFSPDGKILASFDGKKLHFTEVATGNQLRTIESGKVLSIAFSPDGTMIAGSDDKTIKLWNSETGEPLRTLKGNTGNIWAFAFSPDGKVIASGSDDKTIKIWVVATGEQLRSLEGHTGRVTSVAFSRDGELIVSASPDKTAKLWSYETGRLIRSINAQDINPLRSSAMFSPDGRTVAVTGAVSKLWDVAQGTKLRSFEGHASTITSIAFSPDGKALASSSDGDRGIQLWDIANGGLKRSFAARLVDSIAFSPDGKTIAGGSRDKTITVWDVATGKVLHKFQGHTSGVTAIAFSPDGRLIASCSTDKSIKIWSNTGDRLHRSIPSACASITFSPDGKVIATNSDSIKLWDVATGTQLRSLAGRSAFAIAYNTDGKLLASGSIDGIIDLWDSSSGSLLRSFGGRSEMGNMIRALAFSNDGKLLTGLSMLDKTIRVWDLTTGRESRRFESISWVGSMSFSPDGTLLAGGSLDGTVKLWSSNSDKLRATVISLEQNDWIVITPEGHFDASPGAEKLMHYVLSTPERGYEVIEFDQLKLRYYEPGLLQKIVKGESLRDVSALRDVRLTPDVQELQSSSRNPASTKRTIKLTSRGGGIGRVQVFVNDREFIEDARDQKLKQNPEVKEAFVTFDLKGAAVIAGEQPRVKVIAWNYDPQAKDKYKGYISSRGTELVYTPLAAKASKPATKPELYAIIGGVSDYDGAKLDLRFAAKDAEDIAKAIHIGGKNLFGVERTHVTLLTTGLATGNYPGAIAPTKANFQKAFAAYAKQAKPEDIFFVYLSGHGITMGHGSDTYLYLTKDANTTDVDQLKKDSDLLTRATISSDELKRWFKSVNALKQVLILDTCAAGAAAAKLSSATKDVQTDAIRAIDQMQDVTGFHVLMGSTADAVSYEATEYGQGLLTYSLLQGIKSGEALEESGRVDVSRLFQYAANKVPQLARNIGGIQRPEIRGPSGDSKSFPLGLISSVADKKEIPLESPKPLILRPVLQNQKLGYDNLKLTALLRDALREASYATVRGRDVAPLVFVDAEEMPDAIIPSGNYTIEGETSPSHSQPREER